MKASRFCSYREPFGWSEHFEQKLQATTSKKALLTFSWLLQRPGHGAMELHKAHDQPFAVPVTRRSPEWGWLEYLLHAS